MDQGDLQTLSNSVPRWFHSLDLGYGIVTPGVKTQQLLAKELADLHLPDLRNKEVLDVGAWDGFYSFEAERRGAKRVVALDHYVWSVDWEKGLAYRDRCLQQGIVRKEWPDVPEVWRPDTLPGKRGFDIARQALKSQVEPRVADFMEVDLGTLGHFDVVFYLGVLYHMKHPLLSLQRLAAVTREVAIIETEAIFIAGQEDSAMWEFYETTELNNDPSNWWVPNRKALACLCRAAGFRQVEIVSPPPYEGLESPKIAHYRLSAHAWK